ncbi:membrane hypothetical protein [metagenome]|uniref:Glycosyltransferase RgtA/B/C/D-like domain-containing protein n=1 Tax=metagenome TaxID=256318 RepID=A0A2P2BZ90_9ZZZZ
MSRAGRSRADAVVGWLFAAHVVLSVVLLSFMATTPLHGDEVAYADGARALSNLVRDLVAGGPVDSAELQRNVVGSGWFMPGSSILLTPLFVVVPEASTALIRGYLALVTTGLLWCCVVTVRRVLGVRYAAALLVVPGLIPIWTMFSAAAWGDLGAGLLVVVLLARLVELVRGVRAGRAPSPRQGAALGLVAIAVVYLRSSASLLVLGMIAVAVLVAATSACRTLAPRQWARAAGALVLAGVVFVGLLAPWSVFASQTLGGRVVTTTSVPTVMANTFGDRERLCFGPCDPGSTIWFTPLRYSREVARATGVDELEVQRQMSAYARQGMTPEGYARDVAADSSRYFLRPTGFVSILSGRPPGDTRGVVLTVTSSVLYVGLAAGWLFALLAQFRRRYEEQVLSLLLKVGLLALFVQPFVHLGGSRYWTTAAPLGGLALGLAATMVGSAARARPAPVRRVEIDDGVGWLTLVQAVLTALAVSVPLMVAVVAA